MHVDEGPGIKLEIADIPLPLLAAKRLSELTAFPNLPPLTLLLTERCKKYSDKDSDL